MHDQIALLRDEIYATLFSPQRRRGFRAFVAKLRAVQYVPGMKERGKYLEHAYLYHRAIDDVVDGDVALSPRYHSLTQFVEERMEHLRSGRVVEPLDRLAVFMRRQAEEFGQDFAHENSTVLGTMLFDAKRRDEYLAMPIDVRVPRAFPAAELAHHYLGLDIDGCVKSMLKIYDEPTELVKIIAPLARAVRHYYDARDFAPEFRNGLLNISEETLSFHGITPVQLSKDLPYNAFYALNEHVAYGLHALEEYRSVKSQLKQCKPLTRISLYAAFERPTERFFREFRDWGFPVYCQRYGLESEHGKR